MAIHLFRHDESGYLDWVLENPTGYVVNTRQKLDPSYLVLHRASCWSMKTHRNQKNNPGGFTERGYQKICSSNLSELKDYLFGVARTRSAFTKVCSLCDDEQERSAAPEPQSMCGGSNRDSEPEKGDRISALRSLNDLLDDLELRLGGARKLKNCSGRDNWPARGVYFFREPGEKRADTGDGLRVVRVGTHALKRGSATKLWTRLSQHKGVTKTGGGNHRGSIFRLVVGAALIGRDGLDYPTWGKGNSAPREVRDGELTLEQMVSAEIGDMSFVWLGIDDEPGPNSLRGHIERNSIALLSNCGKESLDAPSADWLGRFCNRALVRQSGLWNSNYVADSYDPEFLDIFERLVSQVDRNP